jgi:hypothetical protein
MRLPGRIRAFNEPGEPSQRVRQKILNDPGWYRLRRRLLDLSIPRVDRPQLGEVIEF